MKYKLKKNFQNCPKGSEVVISDISTAHKFGGRPIYWYNVIDEWHGQIKLGNSETMNVDEWVEMIKEPREFQLVVAGSEKEMITLAYPMGKIIPCGILANDAEIIKVREIMAGK